METIHLLQEAQTGRAILGVQAIQRNAQDGSSRTGRPARNHAAGWRPATILVYPTGPVKAAINDSLKEPVSMLLAGFGPTDGNRQCSQRRRGRRTGGFTRYTSGCRGESYARFGRHL